MTSHARGPIIAAALALIVLPLIALVLKGLVYPGWMMVIIVWTGLPLALGYALQLILAIVSMLRQRGAFNRGRGARRGLIAAWVTSVSFLIAMFFLVDGGDDGSYGSAFTELVGMSSTSDGERLSMSILPVFAVVWLAGWVWLMIEWIVLTSQARKAAEGAEASA